MEVSVQSHEQNRLKYQVCVLPGIVCMSTVLFEEVTRVINRHCIIALKIQIFARCQQGIPVLSGHTVKTTIHVN